VAANQLPICDRGPLENGLDMNVLKASGVTPAWVQIGNEINSGICHPVGALAHYPAQMSGLLNAAYSKASVVWVCFIGNRKGTHLSLVTH
jgi:hypothetical protein